MTSAAKIERHLYLASRGIGDLRAAQRGQLPRRIVMRHVHRLVLHKLHTLGLW